MVPGRKFMYKVYKLQYDPGFPVVGGELGRFFSEKAPEVKDFDELLTRMASKHANRTAVSSVGLNHKGDSVHFGGSPTEIGKMTR